MSPAVRSDAVQLLLCLQTLQCNWREVPIHRRSTEALITSLRAKHAFMDLPAKMNAVTVSGTSSRQALPCCSSAGWIDAMINLCVHVLADGAATGTPKTWRQTGESFGVLPALDISGQTLVMQRTVIMEQAHSVSSGSSLIAKPRESS